nr:YqhR family membrane protein [Heyndrickxia oleronia]
MSHMEEKHSNHRVSFISMALVTGFIGGILWSLLAYLCYYFNFTKIEPNILLEPFTVGNWRGSWIGIIITIIMYGIISIGVALVYYLVLKKFKSMWVGIAYGLILYLVVFFILNPIFPSMKPFFKNDYNTLITSACIYALYGLFVGYSISYEHNEFKYFRERKLNE